MLPLRGRMRHTHWLVVASALMSCGAPPAEVDPLAVCRTTSACFPPYDDSLVDKVDLLLVVDDSSTMGEEQQLTVAELPRVVQALVSGDYDGDGVQEINSFRSIHVGIVDTDMGVGDVTGVAHCDTGFGDDGLMRVRRASPPVGCSADYSGTYPGNVFDFTVGVPTTPAAFAADVGCIAALGTDGCGYPFALEAALKAISLVPTATGDSPVNWTHAGYRPPTFYAGTFGHGGDPATNGAFLRPDSVLAIVVVTDQDDCSTGNPQIFSPTNPDYSPVMLSLRCHEFGTELFPTQRYVDGLVGLRAAPRLLVFGAIAGVPLALSGAEPSVILADPQMIAQVDPSDTAHLVPACASAHGTGAPAIRLTELAVVLDAFGAHTVVQSICAPDLGPAFDGVLARIARTFPIPGCFAVALPLRADGSVDCRYEVTLPADGTQCSDIGLTRSDTRSSFGEAFEVCELPQLTRERAGLDVGWIRDDGTLGAFSALPAGCSQRIAYSRWTPPGSASLTLVCP